MNTADRRAEIINILLVRRRITAKELAEGIHKKVLFQIICKYGPDRLEL